MGGKTGISQNLATIVPSKKRDTIPLYLYSKPSLRTGSIDHKKERRNHERGRQTVYYFPTSSPGAVRPHRDPPLFLHGATPI